MTALPEDPLRQPDMEPVVPSPLIFNVNHDRDYDPAGEVPLLLERAKSLSFSLSNSVLMRLEDRYIGGALANSMVAYMDCIEANRPGVIAWKSQYGDGVEIVDSPTRHDNKFSLKNYSGTLIRTTFFPQARQAEIIPGDYYALPEHIISNINGITIGLGNKGNTATYGIDGTIRTLTWQTYCDSTSSYKARTEFDPETAELTTTYTRAYDAKQELRPGGKFIRFYWDSNSTRMMRCVNTSVIQATPSDPTNLKCTFESYDNREPDRHSLDIVQAPILFPPDIFPISPDGSHTLDFEEYQAWLQANWQTQFPRLQQRQTVISHKHGPIEELEI